METVNNIINQVLIPLLSTILLGIVGWLGVKLKHSLDEKEKNKTFLEIIARSICATEQIYKTLHGREKLKKCVEIANGMLATRGIEISEDEIVYTIEAMLAEFNGAFDAGEAKQPPVVAGFVPAESETPAEEQAEG